MKKNLALLFLCPAALWANPGLTIYNQGFAAVRDSVALDLKKGTNSIVYDGATLLLEPDSVILRGKAGTPLNILEQNYRNDPVTQRLLLSLFEGQELDFIVRENEKPDRVVRGKVIRSGSGEGASYSYRGDTIAPVGPSQPIVEVDGKVRFSLPGEPVFPSLGDDTILKPKLAWQIEATKPQQLEAELGYVTGGLAWEASYNIVAPEKGNVVDVIGWVTMQNNCGRDFADASIKLLAGDVNRVGPQYDTREWNRPRMMAMQMAMQDPQYVKEKTFDEYHLYTLERPVTLRNMETKQVEFVRATGVQTETVYIYDGVMTDWDRYRGHGSANLSDNDELGVQSSTTVKVLREFMNSQKNNLGVPLPRGKIRFYRADGSNLEFTGENLIGHTPKDELVKVYTGEAFDITGERKRTDFNVDSANHHISESFEIVLHNHKKEPVNVRVVEHLYRWHNWDITQKNADFIKIDPGQIQFRVDVPAEGERKLNYTVVYTW
ncbi:MAG: hypothetical protein FGM15_08165 [Chthoniobacterales bacterium]|nr:hypothetical protein [Chthoniobacterales bacterium]